MHLADPVRQLLAVSSALDQPRSQKGAKVASWTVTNGGGYVASNNSVYFGKLSGYGSANPVLTDVSYIVSKQDPTTKQVQNVLVKRDKELHGPDRMYLNANSIVFVEPVGTDSKVAQLIQEANQESAEVGWALDCTDLHAAGTLCASDLPSTSGRPLTR